MFNGIHALIYTRDAEADRAFFRDALGFRAVDAGHGWLIFALPPAELAFHPAEDEGDSDEGGGAVGRHEMWLMCDDIHATRKRLAELGATDVGEVADYRWGLASSFRTPAGTKLSLYQPKHPTAIGSQPSARG